MTVNEPTYKVYTDGKWSISTLIWSFQRYWNEVAWAHKMKANHLDVRILVGILLMPQNVYTANKRAAQEDLKNYN